MIKRWKKALSVGLAAAAAFGTALSASAPEAPVKAVLAAEGAQSPYVSVPAFDLTKDRTKSLGTEENPFVVLELVPYEGYAEIGYLVEGEEPIDFGRMKYAELPALANFLDEVASIGSVGKETFWAVSKEQWVDYYRNPVQLETEDYPEGFLETGRSEMCYGYFVKVPSGTGQYNLSGSPESMDMLVAYRNNHDGNYDFVVEYVGSNSTYDWQLTNRFSHVISENLERFSAADMADFAQRTSRVAGGETVEFSRYLTKKLSYNEYCCRYKGKYGRFVRNSSNQGAFQINGNLESGNFEIIYCETGGQWDFIENGEPYYAPDMFDGVGKVKLLSASGDITGEASIAYLPSVQDKIYVNYHGKYGYLKPNWNNGGIKLEGDLNSGFARIWEMNGNGNYDFVEETGAERYFQIAPEDTKEITVQLYTKETEIIYEREGRRRDSVLISYSDSTLDKVYASMRFFITRENEFHNKNYFVTQSIGVPEEDSKDYKIRVITVTPETLEGNQALIDAADFINITDICHVQSMLKTWGKYYRQDMFSPDEAELNAIANGNFAQRTFLENDISWEVTVKLLKRISMPTEYAEVAPMSFAVTCYWGILGGGAPYTTSLPLIRKYPDGCGAGFGGTGCINNIMKLYLMLAAFQTDEEGYFYKNFIETEIVKEETVELEGKLVTTGYFDNFIAMYGDSSDVRTAARYWNEYTFLQIENHVDKYATNHNHESAEDQLDLYKDSAMITLNGQSVNNSVRNNVYTYNSDCSLTQHIIDESRFGYEDTDFRREPFELLEFADRTSLSPADILYYLLHQERSSIQMLINGSKAERIFSNVSYDAKNKGETALAGEIITVEDDQGNLQLYGRVRLNVSLSANRRLKDSLVEITIYRDPSYDAAQTPEREDIITITEAYNAETRELEPIRLDTAYYYDIPLDLLATSNTEDLKFSLKVHYNYKGIGSDAETNSYSSVKKIYEYELKEDGTVRKDERRILTFVRRALFFLD